MTDYYCDPGAGGNSSPYANWTDAATDFQIVADLAAAGDKIYCRGIQTLTVGIDIDQNVGAAGSWIQVIGCNASGNEDGTTFKLNANGVAAHGLDLASSKASFWNFRNIEVYGATSDGIYFNSGVYAPIVFFNCHSHDNGGDGWSFYYTYDLSVILIGCSGNDNSGNGFDYLYRLGGMFFCAAIGNSGDGWDDMPTNFVMLGCIAHDNGGVGFDAGGSNNTLIHCVADENGSSGIRSSGLASREHITLLGCRITNNGDSSGYGIDTQVSDSVAYFLFNFFKDNYDGAYNGSIFEIKNFNGITTNLFTGTEGYTDGGNDDFTLASDASLRNSVFDGSRLTTGV